MTSIDAESDWNDFTRAAAKVLSVNAELFEEALPALVEEPYNPVVQDRLREFLGSPRFAAATDAAHRLMTHSNPGETV